MTNEVRARVEGIMKSVLVIVVVVLLLTLLALPLAMGMDMHGGSCPACTSAEHSIGLGMCLAVLSSIVLVIFFASTRFQLCASRLHRPPPMPSLFRPPRSL